MKSEHLVYSKFLSIQVKEFWKFHFQRLHFKKYTWFCSKNFTCGFHVLFIYAKYYLLVSSRAKNVRVHIVWFCLVKTMHYCALCLLVLFKVFWSLLQTNCEKCSWSFKDTWSSQSMWCGELFLKNCPFSRNDIYCIFIYRYCRHSHWNICNIIVVKSSVNDGFSRSDPNNRTFVTSEKFSSTFSKKFGVQLFSGK